jgi:hypothetical protein
MKYYARVQARLAREFARKAGWMYRKEGNKMIDVCPRCLALDKEM